MSRFEFIWTLFLIGVLVLIGSAAEFFIPDPNAFGRDLVAQKKESQASAPGEIKEGEVTSAAWNGLRSAPGVEQSIGSEALRIERPLGESRASMAEGLTAGGGDAQSGNSAVPVEQPNEPANPWVSEPRIPQLVPLRKGAVPPLLLLDTAAAFAFDITNDKVLFEHNPDERLPLASITKLMTALVVRSNFSNEQIMEVSKSAVMTEGAAGELHVGEKLSVEKLLYFLLLPSSNDASAAFAEAYPSGGQAFVQAMNERAQAFGLERTRFVNPSGLDAAGHVSTVRDIARMAQEFWKDAFLAGISGTASIDLASDDGLFSHHLVSSNKLLGRLAGVVGGKTGYTAEASQTMTVFVEVPKEYIIHDVSRTPVRIVTVVLGSSDRHGDSRKIIEWLYQAYEW